MFLIQPVFLVQFVQPLIPAMPSLRELFIAAIKSLQRGKSLIQALLFFWSSPKDVKASKAETVQVPVNTIQQFLQEAEKLLLSFMEGDGLRRFSGQLKSQFKIGLQTNPACMLPSYNHQMPNGLERGQYLALDVGGSTLRVALVELRGREARGQESAIVCMRSFKIDADIKGLEGVAFFDWMALRVLETISNDIAHDHSPEKPIPMGLAWSFPIQYV